jgi:UDP-4-amino-4,6-dideoxy-N-acetyl-beta-L-altrosamine transaminase
MIPYGKQDINQDDIDAVVNVLRSDFLTQGPKVPEFEACVANYCGAKHALAVNSATSALHVACLALGLGPGDWLWTSPNTFVASANCGLYCGAQVDFVDIDPLTYNISPIALEKKLIIAQVNNVVPKVVVAVHLAGQPCDMKALHKLSRKYGFKLIEDASHAIGGRYLDEPIGSCRFSDITVFSFHPVKVITTAEGGMVLTQSDELAQRMDLFRSHGITRDPKFMTSPPDGPWYYQQIELGFNSRLTDLQAALGVSQMARLDEFVALRHKLAKRYDELLADIPITTPWQHPDGYSGYHLYVVRLKLNQIKFAHGDVFQKIRELGVGVNLHYIPVHLHPYYQRMGFKVGDFPQAEQYYREAISLPMYPSLTEVQQDAVVSALQLALSR